eukprot:5584892-Prymnesium_polylepis.1
MAVVGRVGRGVSVTTSIFTVSYTPLSDGPSVRGSGRGAAQLTYHQPRVTRGKRVGVENAVPRRARPSGGCARHGRDVLHADKGPRRSIADK